MQELKNIATPIVKNAGSGTFVTIDTSEYKHLKEIEARFSVIKSVIEKDDGAYYLDKYKVVNFLCGLTD